MTQDKRYTVTPDNGVCIKAPEGFGALCDVLGDAVDQAAHGKGRERHGHKSVDFQNQPMMQITKMVGPGFPLGQAIKKSQEAATMIERGQNKAARRELLGAIVYLAGAAMHLPCGDRVQWPDTINLYGCTPQRVGDKARTPSQQPDAKTGAGGSSPIRPTRLRGFLDRVGRTLVHLKFRASDAEG